MTQLRYLIFVLTLLYLYDKANAQPTIFSSEYPLLIKQNDKFGYINRQGQTVISPKYELADLFSEGLAPVLIKGKWGYIDVNGEIVIPPIWDNALGFSGVAVVYKKMKRMYIDKQGRIIFRGNKYNRNTSFSEGYAVVSNGKHWGYIDSTGSQIINFMYNDAYNFSNGLAKVQLQDKWSYIDYKGRIVLTTNFEKVYNFSNDIAIVYSEGKNGVINKNGELVIPLHYASITKFKMGIASYQLTENGKWGYISKEGKILTEPIFSQARSFFESFAAVKINSKWGYLNSNFDTLISLNFDEAYSFSDERAFVKKNNKYGVIDNTGKIIVPPMYDDFNLNGFKNGIAMVYIGGTEKDFFTVGNTTVKMGYIDKNGYYIWKSLNW
jgi:hypothetical protein